MDSGAKGREGKLDYRNSELTESGKNKGKKDEKSKESMHDQ